MRITCCQNCNVRHVFCHDHCKRYKAEREKLDKAKVGIDAVDAYKKQRKYRIKGR
ncbi:hypothetical protein [Anaerotignum sp. MB30-C6]|uniref:hypothetical protein n=1 Tax=Anaerotignum sp. MB30-C6 TaxID=3070814 RepID=UPI0027DBF788|nr:hypothetical protein [Anaerotignum sp. MB30-C6]WMI81928.1 hypothetical protein RBQ60_04140 [Anaerotignum sp. MB30-C6]